MTSPRTVALVLATNDSTGRAWAISGALATARRLARGRKVLLADLQCGTPSALAAALGAEETPGIIDVLFRGASFGSVARRPPSEPFAFLPPGERPRPPAEIYRHPGWAHVVERLRGTNAVFLACVSADDWVELGPIPGFEACIVFNGTDGAVRLPPGAKKITEVVAPSEGRSRRGADSSPADIALPEAAAVRTEPAPGLGMHPARTSELDETEDPFGVAGAVLPGSAALRTHLEYIESLQRQQRRRKRVIYASIVTAVWIALAATVWLTTGAECLDHVNAEAGSPSWGKVSRCMVAELGSLAWLSDAESEHAAPINLARTDRSGDSGSEDGASGAARSACGDADPGCEINYAWRGVEQRLPYSVVVGEFSTLDEAMGRLEESKRIPVPFYVAPMGREGVRYRLFAGLLSDRLDAEELLSRLVYSGMKDSLAENDIKHVGYTYSFGVFRSETEARSLLRMLLEHGVPGYLVPAGAAGERGGPPYHVYAGAFETSAESALLRGSIRRAGLMAELVERTGPVSN